jgi:hypothetical protein
MIRFTLSLVLLMVMVVVEAVAETRTLNFKDFNEVAVASGIRVSIKQGNTYQITATGIPDELKRLQVKQSGKHLEFKMPNNFQFRGDPISLDITMPALLGLDLIGGSNGNFTMDIGSQPFKADVSGGAELRGQIRSGDIDLTISGGSRATLSGSGQRLSLDGSGGAGGNLSMDIGSQPFKADLSGGSELRGKIRSGDIDLTLSGGSTVTLSGSGRRLSIDGSAASQFELGQLAVTEVNGSLSAASEAVYHKNAKLGSVDTDISSQLRRGR